MACPSVSKVCACLLVCVALCHGCCFFCLFFCSFANCLMIEWSVTDMCKAIIAASRSWLLVLRVIPVSCLNISAPCLPLAVMPSPLRYSGMFMCRAHSHHMDASRITLPTPRMRRADVMFARRRISRGSSNMMTTSLSASSAYCCTIACAVTMLVLPMCRKDCLVQSYTATPVCTPGSMPIVIFPML